MKKYIKNMSNSLQQLPPLSALPPLSKPIAAKTLSVAKSKVVQSSESEEVESYSENEDVEVEEVHSKKMDNDASFFATIIDGSSFRYLIEYLRLLSIDGTFVFTKDSITLQKEDQDKIIFNDIKIKTYELIDYEFSSTNAEIPATINLSDLRNKTRTVGKKEQMDIYKRPGEPSNFYIQVRSQEKSSGDNPVFYCMPMKSENVTIYKLPEYSRGKNNPNCTIYQSDFSKVCKALAANKCSHAEFVGYDKGIIIKGITSDGKIAMIKEYGKCRNISTSKTSNTKSIVNINDKNITKPQIAPPKLNVKDVDEIERFKIHINVIKSLSKINGFCNNGTIKFYIEAGAPLKLCIPIGTFGKMRILIRSS